MDSSTFFTTIEGQNQISDLNNHPNKFIFQKCCQSLERLSIRNAHLTYQIVPGQFVHDEKWPFSQNTLIKFVRNAAPLLKWLRSDLTQSNIDVLHKERPDIKLLN